MKLAFEEYSETCIIVWTEHRQRYLGDIEFDVSCGWVYLTDEDGSGYFTAEFLRCIADKLDELNTELFKDFPQEPEPVSPN